MFVSFFGKKNASFNVSSLKFIIVLLLLLLLLLSTLSSFIESETSVKLLCDNNETLLLLSIQ